MSPQDLAVGAVRAVHLLGLAVVPRALSPDPLPPENLPLVAGASAALLGAIVFGAFRFHRFMAAKDATAASVLAVAAVLAAIVGAFVYRGEAAPLAHGATLVALPAWGALACAASASGARWFGSSIKHKRMTSATIVLAIGAKLLLDAAPLLGSDDKLWRAALRRAPDHERAVREVGRALVAGGKLDDARRVADRCLGLRARACACVALRADVAERAGEPPEVVRAAREAAATCAP